MDAGRRRVLLRSVLALALLGAGVVAGQMLAAEPEAPAATSPGPSAQRGTTAPTPDPGATELTDFRATEAGFALSYPAAWQRLEAADPEVALAAAGDDGGSLQVRVIDLDKDVAPEELPAFRQLTRDIVTSTDGVALLDEPRRTELAGLPGYFYFYAFEDAASDRRGVHSHYFLFHGDTLITLVFQALPATRFDDLAPLFDRVATSFEAL